MTALETQIEASEQAPAMARDAKDGHFGTDHLKADLKQRSMRGAAFTMTAQGATFALTLGSQAVLARALSINDFGLVAMVTAATGFAAIVKDFGLSSAVMQRSEINHQQISTLFWINAAVSLALSLIVAAIAPILVMIFGVPELLWIGLALAVVPLLDGLAVQHQGLMGRQMRFGAVSAIEISSLFIAVAGAVAAAKLGAGYWSLVILQVIRSFVFLVAMWSVCRWRPSAPRRGTGVKPMLFFGGNLTIYSIVDYFCRDIDKFIVGLVGGQYGLGLFSNAQKLMQLPIQQINAPLGRVALPALSRLNDQPNRFRWAFTQSITLMMRIMMPMIVGAMFWGDKLILLVLGDKWADTIPIFEILAIGMLIRPLSNAAGWLFLARGQTGRLLAFRLATFWVTPVLYILGAWWGGREGDAVIGVAAGSAVSAWALCIPWLIYAERGTGIGVWNMLRTTLLPMFAAFAAAAAVRFLVPMGDSLILGMTLMPIGYLALLCMSAGGLKPIRDFHDSALAVLGRKAAA